MFKLNPFHKHPPAAPSAPDPAQSEQPSTGIEVSRDKRASRTPHFPFTEEGIRARAQKVYEKRTEEGVAGTPEEDWQKAIKELRWERSPLARIGRWTGLGEKKGWDFLQLLVAPIVVAAIGLGVQQYLKDNDQRVADDKARQDTLVKYLDQMTESIKDGLLKAEIGSDKFIIAQSRTVVALQALDSKRQKLLIQFLQASGLNGKSKDTDPKKLVLSPAAPDKRFNFDDVSMDDVNKDTGKGLDESPVPQLPKERRGLLFSAQMEKANLVASDLSGGILIGANLQLANLGCISSESKSPEQCSDLSRVDLSYADLRRANLQRANLTGANLYGANLREADLTGADLTGADLRDAALYGANLSSSRLDFAKLKGPVSGSATLGDANLSEVNFNGVDLSDAILYHAKLNKTHFLFANLRHADLSESDLSGADLGSANLSGASLSGANLNGANLSSSILLATDLRSTQALTKEKLEGKEMPLLCGVALPKEVSVNPNRDCDRLPEVLLKDARNRFTTLEDAKKYVGEERQKKWK